MEFTVTVTSPSKQTALTKALQAYNASSAQPLSLGEFVQKLVDGQLEGLVKSYVVAQMDPFTWLKTRFTSEERAAIRAAALVDGAVADMCAMTDKADMIHFDDPLVIESLAKLEAAALLAAGRPAEIIAL